MTNNIDNRKQVAKFFTPKLSEFKKIFRTNYNLKAFEHLVETPFAAKIIDWTNYFIYYIRFNKNPNLINTNTFTIQYDMVLKSICLLSLAVVNNYTNNIFRYDFTGYHNPYIMVNKYNLPDKYYLPLQLSSNNLFSYAYYLHKILDSTISLENIYNILYDLVILIMISNDNTAISKLLFFKRIKKEYSEENTSFYLIVFKNLRSTLQKVIPEYFNNLVLLLNTF